MWVVVQAGICLAVLLFACFFVGKKIGERKISRVHEEMKALEKSFNHLLEQMELVSGHNLKVLEAKVEELREMLHAADKKCLYANDLLQEVENTRRDVQARLTSLPATAGAGDAKRLRQEIQGKLDELEAGLHRLDHRVETLEAGQQPTPEPAPIAAAASSPLLSRGHHGGRLAAAPPPAPPSPLEVPPPVSPLPPSPFVSHAEKVVPFKHRDEIRAAPPLPQDPPYDAEAALAEMVLAAAARNAREMEAGQDISPCQPHGLPLPEPGTPFHDVIKLANEGVAIPQIARILKMGKGEVELIMNIYGNRMNMRRVM